MIQRSPAVNGTTQSPDPCQTATYFYDACPISVILDLPISPGRLSAVQWGQLGYTGSVCSERASPYLFTELYSYTPGGLVTTKH